MQGGIVIDSFWFSSGGVLWIYFIEMYDTRYIRFFLIRGSFFIHYFFFIFYFFLIFYFKNIFYFFYSTFSYSQVSKAYIISSFFSISHKHLKMQKHKMFITYKIVNDIKNISKNNRSYNNYI